MTKETIRIAIGCLSYSKLLTDDTWQELADYLSQHPVMQEGKEGKAPCMEQIFGEWCYACNTVSDNCKCSRLPVDDEQPEGKEWGVEDFKELGNELGAAMTKSLADSFNSLRDPTNLPIEHVPEKSPHEQDMEKLHQMMKEHPEGGSMYIRSSNPFRSGNRISWGATNLSDVLTAPNSTDNGETNTTHTND